MQHHHRPDGDMSQRPHKLPKVSSDQLAVLDSPGGGVQFGPGDLKILLQRGICIDICGVTDIRGAAPHTARALCDACINTSTAIGTTLQLLCCHHCCWHCHTPCLRTADASFSSFQISNLITISSCTATPHHYPRPVCPFGCPGSPTRASCKLLDYARLPGGGRSLFNEATEPGRTTELVELRVYVRKGGKVK
jgi:hypothetical protein